MKKRIAIVLLVGLMCFLIGYFVRSWIAVDPDSSGIQAHVASHPHEEDLSVDDIVGANKLVDDWLRKNKESGSVSDDSSVAVVPLGGNGVDIRWHRLDEKQLEELSAIVFDYIERVVDSKPEK